jgi:hypothetical protein
MNLSANEKTTLFLPAGQVLSVVAASGASGSAIRMAKLPGGGDAQSITAIAGANLTFGPYAATERFEIICTAGTLTIATAFPDPATLATDIEVAAVVAALLTGTLSGSDTTHAPTVKAVFDALALKAPLASPSFTGATSFAAVGLPEKTPVNATPTMLTLPVADLAILEAGDTVGFEGATFTKVSSDPAAGEFIDAAGLAALLNALEGWTGAEETGVVTATSDALGTAQNGKIATITHLGATTSGGSEVAKAVAKLTSSELAQLAVGDDVTFDGSTFTKAAATSVPDNEFADVTGLISCIDGMTAWAAVLNGSDIDIEAAEVGAASNEKVINLIYYRASAGAIDGTVGVTNEICADTDYIYHCVGANTVAGANWRRIARGLVY